MLMAWETGALPPLEWIRVFEAAGRTGSFTEAARETGLTQAAVSQRIRNLESRLGSRLFDRRARGVDLTVDGEAWLPHVQIALRTLANSTDELFAAPLRKTSITASASVIQLWMAPRLKRLAGSHPDLQVSFATMNVQTDFPKTDADIEVRYSDGQWQDRRCERLFREALSPVAAPAICAGAAWEQLPRIAISGPRPGWGDWIGRYGGMVRTPQYRFESFGQALNAAEAGAGVLLGSIPLCQQAIASKRLVRLSEESLEPGEGYWLTSMPARPDHRAWSQLADMFCEHPRRKGTQSANADA